MYFEKNNIMTFYFNKSIIINIITFFFSTLITIYTKNYIYLCFLLYPYYGIFPYLKITFSCALHELLVSIFLLLIVAVENDIIKCVINIDDIILNDYCWIQK